jgi:hypothetical protein
MSRGEAAVEVKRILLATGSYQGEVEEPADVLVSDTFGDMVVNVKLSEVVVEKSDPNLRKPFVNVVKDDTVIPISADININAADNKFVATVLGRTGAYCTACKCEASDMVGHRPLEPYYMDCGVRDVREIFEDNFVAAYGELESRTEGDADRVLPSAAGDYRRRFGAKHAPMTDSLETTKVKLVP